MKSRLIFATLIPMFILIYLSNIDTIIRIMGNHTIIAWLLLGILFSLEFLVLKTLPNSRRKKGATTVEVVSEKTEQSLVFLMTYLFPIILIDLENLGSALSGLLIIIGFVILLVKFDVYIMNPILAILGYRFYCVEWPKLTKEKVEDKGSELMVRGRLKSGDVVSVVKISGEISYGLVLNDES